ncbi:MAG: Uncharacterized protein XD78_1549 [Desulfotomaculum sp. 46_296]|nr:MAG: Uncharacterized protein XD78_1549 [Desulfotomaculum sp. 46_296]HAU31522.1 hypothetical protein [Desulfotomaculum sp.]
MQLPPGERSILASFPSTEAAQKAAGALREAGYDEIQIDRISRYGTSFNAKYNNPANNAASQTGLTLFSSGTSGMGNAEEVLLGTDPSVSGYGDHNYGLAGGRAFLLTLVTSSDLIDQAAEIIKQHGGTV